jgi:ATP-dependent exoDNAse (exonuclease V) beta subunit
LIWNTAQATFESELRRKHLVQVSLDFGTSAAATKLRRLPAAWRTPEFEPSVSWQAELHRARASAFEIPDINLSNTGRHTGTVIHALLKRIASEGVSRWNGERIAGAAPMIRSELLRLGVSRADEPKASRQVIRALTNIIGSERGRWILHAHAEAQSEWAIGGRVEESFLRGTVDRIFRDEEDRLWIIDFKASEHEGSGLEAFLEEQERHYRSQLENYATLVSRLARGPIWLGLYFPLLDRWRQWQFAEESAVAANAITTVGSNAS